MFFQKELKLAKVIPVFKAEDPHIFGNYRPISLLPTISKVYEKCVSYQIINYLTEKNLLYNNQYGFRPGHSTIHPLLKFIDFISQAHCNNQFAIAIFIDLKKAFDTVNHNILLDKLKFFGIKGVANAWFRSYLQDRQQFVSINGTNSSTSTITIGVPQGSVLGPLLFLMYISDMPSNSKFFTLLFADDTTLEDKDADLDNLTKKCNANLTLAANWFQANRLTLNAKKQSAWFLDLMGTASPYPSHLKLQVLKLRGLVTDSPLNPLN